MKHLYKAVARLLFLYLPLLCGLGGALSSCDRSIEILDIACESELVVYAFPTIADEYLLSVSLSRPTAGSVGMLDVESVECTTNGQPDEVDFVHAETHFGMPMAIYRVKGQHHSGDKISICVKDRQHRVATAATTIPSAHRMEVVSVDTVATPYGGYKQRFLQRVWPDAAGTGYYATRLTSVWAVPDEWVYDYDGLDPDEIYHNWDWQNYSSVRYYHLSVDPNYEPLLNHYSDLDLASWNEYYQRMYFFTADDIRSSSQSEGKASIDLHLQADILSQVDYIDVQFYTLSPEYFLMLRHINDQLSNELAEVGLSQTYSTYSNVHGGLGCVAAYACTHYKYTPPVVTDGIYYGSE